MDKASSAPAAAKLPLKVTPKPIPSKSNASKAKASEALGPSADPEGKVGACAATANKRARSAKDAADGAAQPAKRCQVAAEALTPQVATDPYKVQNALLPPQARVPYEAREGQHSYTLRRAGHESRITVLCGSQPCLCSCCLCCRASTVFMCIDIT
jgi:hypothetical protein